MDSRHSRRRAAGSLFQPTRRSVMIGGAAAAIVNPARAAPLPTKRYHLGFLDKGRRQVVVLTDVSTERDMKDASRPDQSIERVEQGHLLTWDRREFGPNALFKITRESNVFYPQDSPDAKNTDDARVGVWAPVKWTLTVEKASFPGAERRPFTVAFVFALAKDGWQVSASMPTWWDARPRTLSAAPIPLDAFLKAATLTFNIQKNDTNPFLQALFGDRIEANSPFALRMDQVLKWSIDAGQRCRPLATSPRSGRLYILDIPLEFGVLRLDRIRSDPKPVAADGAGKALDAPKPAPIGEADKQLFDAEVVHGRPAAISKAESRDGLYGHIEDISGFTTPNRRTPRSDDVLVRWTFDFATRRIGGTEMAVSVALDEAAVASGEKSVCPEPSRFRAAIRHWGYPDHTIAGCTATSGNDARSLGRLTLRHVAADSLVEEGPFEFASLEIVRQLRARQNAVVTRLLAQPTTKEFAADLRLGQVCMAALPASDATPGAAPAVPALVVEATEAPDASEPNLRVLAEFRGRLTLRSAAVRLPERFTPPSGDEPAKPVPGTHITRLGFHEADALVYVPALKPPPATSADAVLPLGPTVPATRAVFDLGRAHLAILRPTDLLALKYRFSGLELLVPWPAAADTVAELAPRGGRSPGRPLVTTAGRAPARDERPLLVVEFPPQHVVERAYFRQIPSVPDLPELTKAWAKPECADLVDALKKALAAPKQWTWAGQSGPDEAKARAWREWVAELLRKCTAAQPERPATTSRDDRIKLRRQIQALTNWETQFLFEAKGPADAPRKTGKDFNEAINARSADLPEEQRIYVGADFLDADARRITLEILRKLKKDEDDAIGGVRQTAWPSAEPLPSADWMSLFRPHVAADRIPLPVVQPSWPTFQHAAESVYAPVLDELELARERRDREYAAFRAKYRMLARELPEGLKEYRGAEWFRGALATQAAALGAIRDKLSRELPGSDNEPFDDVVPARLSGPSRIAFHVDCDDYESDRPGGRIPFSLEALTNWGGMDMVVVRRAERLIEPLQGTRLPPRWARRIVTDDSAILRHQGFTSGGRWSRKRSSRRWEPVEAAVTAAQRLAEVYATSANEPDLFQTAIELPFRLFLSPAQDATWMTAAPRVRRDAGLTEVADFRELWTARLAGSGEAAGVRAVWSPDYRPEALLSTQKPGAPPLGSHAPWALSRAHGLRNHPPSPIEQFRTGLEAFDRHELVVLSSVHGLPVLGRRNASGDLALDADQIDPPNGFQLQGLAPEPYDGQLADLSAIYRPKALSVRELSLSALGGNLDIDAGFQPPASARVGKTLKDSLNLFDALSIERWRQRTVLGRDIVVEVVYKGFLFPLGHRASLVKLTERRFESIGGSPVAVLVQRLFLRIGKPDKRYQAEGQANRGSRWPCERINILTRTTPDLVDARNDQASAQNHVTPRGKIRLDGFMPADKTMIGLCMWPRTAAQPGAEVWFEMQIGDEAVPVRLPLVFVDNIAANDPATMAALVAYYNSAVSKTSTNSPTRLLIRNGQPVVMAPEYKPGDTSFETQWWRVAAEGREYKVPSVDPTKNAIVLDNSNFVRDSFMEGQDQPAFYPVVDTALCRLKTVERFTGSGPLWAQVTFDGQYVANGFADGVGEHPREPSEIYLRVVPGDYGNKRDGTERDSLDLDFKDRGDLGGGVARPTMSIVAISRRLGPINGGTEGASGLDKKPEKPSPTTLPVLPRTEPVVVDGVRQVVDRIKNAARIFPKGKFLGIMELSELLKRVAKVELHPKLTEVIEYGPASLADGAAETAAGIRSALIKTLLLPALDTVRQVRAAWEKLARTRMGQEAPTLEEIYPQIGLDMAALEALLVRAQEPGLSDVAFFESLSAIHEAARRLISTIEAIGRDPLAAASGAQVAFFQRIITWVKDIREAIESLRDLRSLPDMLSGLLKTVVAKAISDRVKDLLNAEQVEVTAEALKVIEDSASAIFPDDRLPDLATLAAVPANFAKNLKQRAEALDTASQAALVKFADEHVLPAAEAVAPFIEAATSIARNLDTIAEEDAAAAELAERLKHAAEEAKRRAIEKALDVLMGPAIARAFAMAVQVHGLWGSLPDPPFTPEQASQFLSVLRTALDIFATLGAPGIARQVLATEQAVCKSVKSVLDGALKALLPAVSQLNASGCVRAGASSLSPVCAATASNPLRELHVLATKAKTELGRLADVELRDKFDKAAAVLFRAIDSLRQPVTELAGHVAALPDACASPSRELVSLVALVPGRVRLMTSAIEALVKTCAEILDDLGAQGASVVAAQIDTMFDFVVAALEQLPKLTVLGRLAEVSDPLKAIAGRLDELAAAVTGLPKTARSLRTLAAELRSAEDLKKRDTALNGARAALRSLADDFKTSRTLDAAALKKATGEASRDLILGLELAYDRVERGLATDIYDLIGASMAEAADDLTNLAANLPPMLGPSVVRLAEVYGVVVRERDKLQGYVDGASPIVGRVLDALTRTLEAGDDRRKLFSVYDATDTQRTEDRLAKEKLLSVQVETAWREGKRDAALVALGELAETWRSPALAELLRRFGQLNASFLRVVILEALDLRGMREELERLVRELVPTKATMSYDLSTPVGEFSLPGVGKVFLPEAGTRLEIKTRASIDLRNPTRPDATIDGHMGPFGIQLFGTFDVVLLNFRGLTFRSGAGRPSGFDVRFGDFVIGEKAKFLKQLEPYVSPKTSSPPVRPMKDKPGIEAIYGVNLGSFGVGTLSFSNVTLNAGARLPFGNNEEAEFIVSIGRSDAPFLISSTIFGGGGYLALLANGKGFIGLETSFDYGGVFTFGFGPLTGTGQITLGLYFRAARGSPAQLGMNFMARGAANIACFSFSTSLFVRLTYVNGKMQGRATYTFSFSIGIDDIDFQIDVYVNQGASAGQGGATAFLNFPGMPAASQFAETRPELLDAFAALTPRASRRAPKPAPKPEPPKPMLRVRAPQQNTKWKDYRGLFDDALDPIVKL